MGIYEGWLERADHREKRRPTDRRCPADVQGGYQLLHRGHVSAAVAILERGVELACLEDSVAAGVDHLIQRVHLVETGVEIDDREAGSEAIQADADVHCDAEGAGRSKVGNSDEAEAVDIELA